ncbi:MAG TPA: 50S ribosomal protein L6 [Saprospiraceae bacterium]|nr:50S ribosomal protein L6 [Saprospiraceae bacterium]
MSRIGKALINIPAGVTIDVSKGNLVTVKGSKGTLSEQVNPDLSVKIDDGVLVVERPTDQKRHREAHGLSRSLINNMVTGVSTGFVKQLELIGVGYRVSNTGNLLELLHGYSHPIYFQIPSEIKLTTKMDKGESPTIIMEAADKQLLGQVCAKIRTYRKPEPYKGKGIKFTGEIIRRKAGKTSGKK